MQFSVLLVPLAVFELCDCIGGATAGVVWNHLLECPRCWGGVGVFTALNDDP